MPTADRETAHSREHLAEARERQRPRGREREERNTEKERGDAVHPFGNRESYGDSSTDLSKFTVPGIKDYFCRKEGRTRCPTFFFFLEKLPKPSLRIPLVFFASLPPLPPPSLLPLLQRGREPSPPRALQGAFHRLFFCVCLFADCSRATAQEPGDTEAPREGAVRC